MKPTKTVLPLFRMGSLAVTRGALDALARTGEVAGAFLVRHVTGDWGEDLSPEDHEDNMIALAQGFRLLSVYSMRDGVKLWVITEADRSTTTILLPEEY